MSDHDTWNMFFAAVVTGWSAHFGYLDGESIELCAKDADALLAESKKREPDSIPAVATETKPRPMALPDEAGVTK